MLVNSVPQSWSPTLRTGAPTPKPQMKTPVCRMIIGYLAGLGVREEDANGHSKTVSLDHWEASERQEHPGAGGGGAVFVPWLPMAKDCSGAGTVSSCFSPALCVN